VCTLEAGKVDKNIVHVALAVYDPKGTYSQHAGVVMASIFERTESPVCVHVLHDKTMTERNRSLLRETAELFGRRVEFHDVSPHIERLEDETAQADREGYPIGMLFRLVIPEILSLDKVIYLDCDVVVNMDIRVLWDVPLEGYSMAGALDVPQSRFSSSALSMRLLGCDAEKYVNSGVLLMNLAKIREKFDVRRGLLWIRRNRHRMKYHDQDLINSYFQGDIKILDGRFNKLGAAFSGDINASTGCILHAAGDKPWAAPKGSDVDRLYWSSFLKTPWGNKLTPEELVDLLFCVFQKSPFTHRRTAQCYGRIFHRLGKDIFLNDAFKTAALFLKTLFHEAKKK